MPPEIAKCDSFSGRAQRPSPTVFRDGRPVPYEYLGIKKTSAHRVVGRSLRGYGVLVVLRRLVPPVAYCVTCRATTRVSAPKLYFSRTT